MEDIDWIEMASIPLLASERNVVDGVPDASKGGDTEGDQNRLGDSQGVVPLAAASPAMRPTGTEGDATPLGEGAEEHGGEAHAAETERSGPEDEAHAVEIKFVLIEATLPDNETVASVPPLETGSSSVVVPYAEV
jgi:hypothetical protein